MLLVYSSEELDDGLHTNIDIVAGKYHISAVLQVLRKLVIEVCRTHPYATEWVPQNQTYRFLRRWQAKPQEAGSHLKSESPKPKPPFLYFGDSSKSVPLPLLLAKQLQGEQEQGSITLFPHRPLLSRLLGDSRSGRGQIASLPFRLLQFFSCLIKIVSRILGDSEVEF